MNLTQTEFEWLTAEMLPLLEECGVQKVFETGDRRRVLQCRRPSQTLLVLLDTSPETGRVHLTPDRGTQPDRPTQCTMLMRKWIQGLVIREVTTVPDDRILIIRGDKVSPDWEPPEGLSDAERQDLDPPRADIALVVELLGRQTNLFVLGPDDTVLGAERPDTAPQRTLKVHDTWQAPPPPPDTEPQPNRWSDAPTDPQEAGVPEDAIIDNAPRSSIAAQWFAEHLPQHKADQLIQKTKSRLKSAVSRLKRLVKNIEGDLNRALEAQQWRKYGELLQSAYGKVARGSEQVTVPDYYEEGMPEVTIDLDPALDLQGNIEWYFKEYRRLHEATDQIEERLLDAMETLERARGARSKVDEVAAQGLDALTEWIEELEAADVLRKRRPQRRSSKSEPRKKRRHRVFSTKQGTRVIVGKGAQGNDEVSTHIARGRDMWFHARDWAGAHVILRMERDSEPHQGDMLDAATLAAYFSKGREDTIVDVTYTRAKHVRKPKGYPTGMVTVADGSTIGVRIEDARLERLLDTEE